MDKNVFLTTIEKNTYPVDHTLDHLQEILDPALFFRINRKIIINFKSIKHMVPYSRSRILVELDPHEPKEVEALVSVERSSSFKEWLDK
jgi:DNA-binding LytR/AlgR family response regulator